MRISEWRSDVCSSDLPVTESKVEDAAPVIVASAVEPAAAEPAHEAAAVESAESPEKPAKEPTPQFRASAPAADYLKLFEQATAQQQADRSEEHTSELQSLMRISYAVFCLKKKNIQNTVNNIEE